MQIDCEVLATRSLMLTENDLKLLQPNRFADFKTTNNKSSTSELKFNKHVVLLSLQRDPPGIENFKIVLFQGRLKNRDTDRTFSRVLSILLILTRTSILTLITSSFKNIIHSLSTLYWYRNLRY